VNERFFVQSLTGHTGMAKGAINRKPTISWSVYDRTFNCKEIAIFFDRDGEERARRYAQKLNEEHEDDGA
jgi:hypothetical protein